MGRCLLVVDQKANKMHQLFIVILLGAVAATATGSVIPVPGSGSSSISPPDSVDWRTKGVVQPTKDQGKCQGGGYAFAAAGAIESYYALETGKLPSFSEQQILDCSESAGNKGCEGGMMMDAYDYLKDAGGIQGESAYPYTGQVGDCKFHKENATAAVSGYKMVKMGSEDDLEETVATVGPVSCLIDGSLESFKDYTGGFYADNRCNSTNLNHGILVVGYSNVGMKSYWIVKNSFGEEWGEKGYMQLAKDWGNMCGIVSMCTYPTLKN